MLVTDRNGLPIGLKLASASRYEVTLAVPALQTVRVPRGGSGRPKQRPDELVADKAYDSKRFRRWLRSKRIKPTIPPYERRVRKRPKQGRPVKVGLGYKERWKVERTFACLGNFRRLLVRHERYLSTFRAFFLIAFVLVLLSLSFNREEFRDRLYVRRETPPLAFPVGSSAFLERRVALRPAGEAPLGPSRRSTAGFRGTRRRAHRRQERRETPQHPARRQPPVSLRAFPRQPAVGRARARQP